MRIELFALAAIYLATGIVIARRSRWREERRRHQLVVLLFWPMLSASRIVRCVVESDGNRHVDALFASVVWSMFCIYIAMALAPGWSNNYQRYHSVQSDSDAQMQFGFMVMKLMAVFALWAAPFVVTAVVWSYRALVDSVRG